MYVIYIYVYVYVYVYIYIYIYIYIYVYKYIYVCVYRNISSARESRSCLLMRINYLLDAQELHQTADHC